MCYLVKRRERELYSSHEYNSLIVDLLQHFLEYKDTLEMFATHMAIVLGPSNKMLGQNTYRQKWPGCPYGTHAEIAAIDSLKINFSKRIKSVDILVVRIRADLSLSNSKPCDKCLFHMSRLPKFTRYSIKNVIYSTNEGFLEKRSYSSLILDEDTYCCKRFRSKKN